MAQYHVCPAAEDVDIDDIDGDDAVALDGTPESFDKRSDQY